MGDKGRIWPSESTAGNDERTGARIWQITAHDSINHGLYFLTDSFLPDEKSLVLASFRNGSANFYQTAFPSGDIRQLTDSSPSPATVPSIPNSTWSQSNDPNRERVCPGEAGSDRILLFEPRP